MKEINCESKLIDNIISQINNNKDTIIIIKDNEIIEISNNIKCENKWMKTIAFSNKFEEFMEFVWFIEENNNRIVYLSKLIIENIKKVYNIDIYTYKYKDKYIIKYISHNKYLELINIRNCIRNKDKLSIYYNSDLIDKLKLSEELKYNIDNECIWNNIQFNLDTIINTDNIDKFKILYPYLLIFLDKTNIVFDKYELIYYILHSEFEIIVKDVIINANSFVLSKCIDFNNQVKLVRENFKFSIAIVNYAKGELIKNNKLSINKDIIIIVKLKSEIFNPKYTEFENWIKLNWKDEKILAL